MLPFFYHICSSQTLSINCSTICLLVCEYKWVHLLWHSTVKRREWKSWTQVSFFIVFFTLPTFSVILKVPSALLSHQDTAITCIHTLHALWQKYFPGDFSLIAWSFTALQSRFFVLYINLVVSREPQEICSSSGYVTCASGGDQFGLAACTIALCRVGCHSNWIRGLSLQLCDDHILKRCKTLVFGHTDWFSDISK